MSFPRSESKLTFVSKHPYNAQHPSQFTLFSQHPAAREKKKFLYVLCDESWVCTISSIPPPIWTFKSEYNCKGDFRFFSSLSFCFKLFIFRKKRNKKWKEEQKERKKKKRQMKTIFFRGVVIYRFNFPHPCL